MRWIELADGVYARRYPELDQTLGLVVGAGRCLVIDTGTDEAHGAEWAAAVRAVTPLPWDVVITHSHWDHFLGTQAFLPARVWAHARCAKAIAADARAQVESWAAKYRAVDKPELAERLELARVVLPDHETGDSTTLELGGRTVELIHFGLGHTDNDVVVHVPDAGVVFAGDTVEQGAPLSIGPDSHQDRWPALLDGILALRPAIVVPGHGEPVDADFVRAQRDALSLD
ncbi:Fumarylacetoacetase [Alloactinosynnema sp. L-07]|uniref:MBL fold metallo-hydrolase n=1 Tax=Alloactinosynnema sp. L-07 TaxID=1653480 RepID=UPI00065F02F3|nr:MBL fold metallo-hydrolase [Alloactinosynnema sp. L-07]CRK55373.1 Fumarylacetoacetase [Alloactinosynnema sp. L-07]